MSEPAAMRVLFVCSGNTCRSPMAEALLRQAATEVGLTGVEVASAGTGAWDGAPASEGAYLVSLEHGLDLSRHRARPLTPELVAAADLVLTMSRGHLSRVRDLGGAGKAHLLGEYAGTGGAEVPDPFGGTLDEYRATFAALQAMTAGVAGRLRREAAGD